MTLQDDRLISQTLAGDREAFGILYKTYRPPTLAGDNLIAGFECQISLLSEFGQRGSAEHPAQAGGLRFEMSRQFSEGLPK